MASLAWILVAAAHAAAAGSFSVDAPDFDRSPAELSAGCGAAKSRADSKLVQIASLPPGSRTFENTVVAIDMAAAELEEETGPDYFLKNVAISSAVRDAASQCEVLVRRFMLDLYTREDLFQAVRAVEDRKPRLGDEDSRLLEHMLRDFRRSGLALSPEKRAELKVLREKLVQLGTDFDRNISEARGHALFTRAQLDGLPADYVSRLSQENGRYKVGTPYPEYLPFMQRARDAGARRELSVLFANRAAGKNLGLLKEMLELRLKAAKLQGYRSHAHYVLETRMAKDPETVRKFLERVGRRLEPGARDELKVMSAFKRAMEPKAEDEGIRAWDWPFYDELVKRVKYEVDQQAIREYFPTADVVEKVLSLYQRVLGLRFQKIARPNAWHPEVVLYEVADAGTGAKIGRFYLDLYPRDGKYSHAAVAGLVMGRRLPDGTYRKPIAALMANFDKPGADRPALLTHRELETLLHELGHIMHVVLTKANYGRFSGYAVAWDFVEAPSQMFEGWSWDPEVLRELSGHYKEPARKLPPELIEKLVASKLANTAAAHRRQIALAMADQDYHDASPPGDTTKAWGRAMEKYFGVPMAAGTHPETSFGHLEGYDAAYYGYMWSEVFAEDMWSRFRKEGVVNPLVGRDYRREILERGGSRDEQDSIKAFLGREPNETSFLEALGLTEKE